MDNILSDLVVYIVNLLDSPSRTVLAFVSKRLRLLTNSEPNHLCMYAAFCGYFNVLEWGVSLGLPLNNSVLATVNGGNLDTLKYLYSVPGTIASEWETAASVAAIRGRVDILEWLQYKGKIRDETPLETAIVSNKDEAVRYLTSVIVTCKKSQAKWCNYVAINGNVSLLKHMIELGYTYKPQDLLFHAAKKGKIPILEYLTVIHNYDYTVRNVFSGVMVGGKIEVLEWLFSKHYPWDWELISRSIVNMYDYWLLCSPKKALRVISVAKWSVSHGCYCDKVKAIAKVYFPL